MSSIVVSIFLGAFKEAGKAQAFELLAKLKDSSTPEEYEDFIKGGVLFFRRMSALAAKSKTKIDDGVVEIFKDPIDSVAEAEGIAV